MFSACEILYGNALYKFTFTLWRRRRIAQVVEPIRAYVVCDTIRVVRGACGSMGQRDRQTDRRTDGRTDGWTPYRYVDPAPHSTCIPAAVPGSIRASVRPSVRLSVCHQTTADAPRPAAGLLLSAAPVGDIDRRRRPPSVHQQPRRSTATQQQMRAVQRYQLA